MKVFKPILIIILFLGGIHLAAQPRHPEENLRIARKCIDQNRPDEAMYFLDLCLAKQPKNTEALLLRARLNNNKRNFQDALTDYQILTELKPENKEYLYSCALTRFHLKHYQMALNEFRKCLELEDGQTETAFFKIDGVENKATGLMTMNRMDDEIINYIGLCHYHLGAYQEAISIFQSGLGNNPDNVDLLRNSAMAFEAMGDYEKAAQGFARVLISDPSNEVALLNLSGLQAGLNKLKTLDDFVLNHPDYALGYSKRGHFYYETGDYVRAEADFERAFTLEPEDEGNAFNLGLCKLKNGKEDEAEILFINLTESNPLHAGGYFNLGNIRFKRGDFSGAVSYFSLALQYKQDAPAYYYNRALAYKELGALTSACEDMQCVKQMDENMAAAFILKFCTDH